MKKLDLSSVTNAAQMPVKKGTLQFLQDSYTEILNALANNLVGSANVGSSVYVIYGCVLDEILLTITQGAVYYNGEIYLVSDGSIPALTGSNVYVWTLLNTQYTTNADPVTFTDTSVHNIHNIRTFVVSQGASGGSGVTGYIDDVANQIALPSISALQTALSTFVTLSTNQTISGTKTFSTSPIVPNPSANQNPTTKQYVDNLYSNFVLASGRAEPGTIGTGGVMVTITFPTPLPTSSYKVLGTIISRGTPNNDTIVLWSLVDSTRTNTSCQIQFRAYTPFSGAISFEYVILSA